jgi:hypothetical protein
MPRSTAGARPSSSRLRYSTVSASQRSVVEADYGMTDGEVALPVRLALLFPFIRRLGLVRGDGLVEIANQAGIDAELAERSIRFGR